MGSNNGLQYLLLIMACLVISSCATQKFYNGVEATNLTELFFGMSRIDAEKITGSPKREFQCESVNSIATYIYDRGYTGCVGQGRCEAENESNLQAIEIGADVFSLGLFSWALNKCISPCQQGHLELFFDEKDRLIGVRERASDRDDYCWNRGNKAHQGYPCNRIYNNRRPSSVREQLILHINPEEICEEYNDYNNRLVINSELQFLTYAQDALSRDDLEATYRLLEDIIISENRVVRKRVRQFMEQHPEIYKGARNSFTSESLKESIGRYGEAARKIEYQRLSIYKTVAPAHDYQKARGNYESVFFGSTD